MSDKIKYWWSDDRQWFCIMIDDGVSRATVSLTPEEADALHDQVMQTPRFLEFQKECADHTLALLDQARDGSHK